MRSSSSSGTEPGSTSHRGICGCRMRGEYSLCPVALRKEGELLTGVCPGIHSEIGHKQRRELQILLHELIQQGVQHCELSVARGSARAAAKTAAHAAPVNMVRRSLEFLFRGRVVDVLVDATKRASVQAGWPVASRYAPLTPQIRARLAASSGLPRVNAKSCRRPAIPHHERPRNRCVYRPTTTGVPCRPRLR
jgi:hypothetical protein